MEGGGEPEEGDTVCSCDGLGALPGLGLGQEEEGQPVSRLGRTRTSWDEHTEAPQHWFRGQSPCGFPQGSCTCC